MDAIAPHATAEGDHSVADLWFGRVRTMRQNSQRPAVHEGIGRIAIVVEHRSVYRRKSELVPVVADATNDTVSDPTRM
jgi:hypothetical protein